MQFMNLCRRDGTRVDFERKLALFHWCEMESRIQRRHQVAKLGITQISRSTATQMQLGHAPRFVEQRTLHLNFLLQPVKVLRSTLGVVSNDLVAGAVVAQAPAE